MSGTILSYVRDRAGLEVRQGGPEQLRRENQRKHAALPWRRRLPHGKAARAVVMGKNTRAQLAGETKKYRKWGLLHLKYSGSQQPNDRSDGQSKGEKADVLNRLQLVLQAGFVALIPLNQIKYFR